MKTLIGKVALVTGGSRGIGAAIVKKLAEEGASVAFTYVASAEKAEASVKQLEADGTKALAIRADNGVAGEIGGAVQQTYEHFGRLDILVNNAALSITGHIDQSDEMSEQFDRQIEVNIKAVASAIRAAAKVISDNGRIVTIGSVWGQVAGTQMTADYGATKAAVAAYSRGYAWDLGNRGITVNTVQPGPIDTEMNPADGGDFADFLRNRTALKRYGTATEVAALVVFLTSPDAGYITGASIMVDGGYSA